MNVYMDVLYIVYVNCVSFIISDVLVILFLEEKNKLNLIYDG
jgi:hypothetical protein